VSIDIARMRLDYETAGISEADFPPDPFEQFQSWFDAAVQAEVHEPNAMVVSTVDAEGQPWSRYVLLKGFDRSGFEFFTNYESNKSNHLTAHPKAAVTFGWLELHRQVNIAGTIERLSEADSDRYWAVRTRGSQLGGWASPQSRQIAARAELTERYEAMEQRFDGQSAVDRPPHWGGWRLVPSTVEFWQGRRNRLHDRLRYIRTADGNQTHAPGAEEAGAEEAAADLGAEPGGWKLVRLAP
jgi:pyridoxamine 5'-phosphate oxidase